MGFVRKIFGGGDKRDHAAEAEARKAQQESLRLQREQEARLEKQEQREKERKKSSLRAARAAQGAGRKGLLFEDSGETGVTDKLGGGR